MGFSPPRFLDAAREPGAVNTGSSSRSPWPGYAAGPGQEAVHSFHASRGVGSRESESQSMSSLTDSSTIRHLDSLRLPTGPLLADPVEDDVDGDAHQRQKQDDGIEIFHLDHRRPEHQLVAEPILATDHLG